MEKKKKNKKKIIVLVISAVILLAVLAVMTVQSRQPVSEPEEMTEEYATVEEAGGAKPEAGQTVGTKTAEKDTSDKTDSLKSDPITTQTSVTTEKQKKPQTTQATASANTKPQTAQAATTEAPKKPGTTQQATTEKPKTTEVPATTEKPKTTEAPATIEAPKKPSTTQAPATTQQVTTEAQKKQVWVVDQAAYDEEVPVYETRCRWICTGCGGYMYSQADIDDHPCIASWYSDIYDVQVGTKTVHHDEVGHWEWK